MVKVLVEILAPKIVPVVPVETLVTTLVPKEIEVEVPIKTLWPPVIARLEPTVKSPKVVVAVPPLVTPKTPETSLPPKAIAPLKSAPPEVDLTGRAWLRVLIVVEPLVVTLKIEVLAPLRKSKTAKVLAAEEVAWIITGIVVEADEKVWICKRAMGEVVPKPTLVPLSKSKELAVVELAVYLVKKLAVPAPESLLLKLVQSAEERIPEEVLAALPKLIVKALVVVEM